MSVAPSVPVVLLPGMDGSGTLFEEFAAKAPPHFRPVVVPLPNSASYDELTESVARKLPPEGPFVIVAESFSGPIAIRLAVRYADRASGLVLVNTFAAPPRLPALRALPWSYVFAVPPPRWVVRALLAGRHASSELVDRVRSAIKATDATTLSGRLRALLSVNEIGNLERIRCPVLLLRGTQDRLVTSRSAEIFLRHRRHIESCEIVGPHLLLQTRPEEAWRAIEEFLQLVVQ